ncbi:MAG TPA: hypothetical protein VKK30_04260 [Actinomycetota bacterium]|nr:hypothetical protein [Actinomycetota bacterium]
MPLRNRVTPFGEIIATPDRGTLFGNRGVLHDPQGRLVRDWQVRRWIACRLEFRGRHRELLQPNRYTELFFLDEATALAAGHRPCAECRREDYLRFQSVWARANGEGARRAEDLDRVLHAQRIPVGAARTRFAARMGDLPDGAMAVDGSRAVLVRAGALRPWSASGYGAPRRIPPSAQVEVLTPASIVRVLAAGYRPSIHPTGTRR